jgi:NADPH-dependent 2,4-dienoyl-CoA reductase/sulfur reductase-like enzyme
VANLVSAVTVDCVDPQRVARFWSALLGREPGPSQDGWVYLGHRGDPQPRLVFQPVPEPKAGKVRVHLDVTVEDVDAAIELVTSLGGRNTGAGERRAAFTCASPRAVATRFADLLSVPAGSRDQRAAPQLTRNRLR